MITQQVIFMFIKVLASFGLVYIIIPANFIRFDQDADGFLDKFFISLVNMVFVIILMVHLLVMVKLYEFISLVIMLLLFLGLLKRWENKNNLANSKGFKIFDSIPYIMQHADSEKGFLKEVGCSLVNGFSKKARQWMKDVISVLKHQFHYILPVIIMLLAAWVRFKPAFLHASYTHIDAYIHLIWSKELGFNNMYFGGVYPRGMHSVYSALAMLSFIDLYWIIRFMGPVSGFLVVLSVYYFTVRITGNRTTGLVPLVIFGLINNADFPSLMFRQTASLTQEFAMVFMLPGLYFLFLYLSKNKNKYLFLFAKCLTIILFTHTYAAMYLVFWSVLMITFWLIIKKPSIVNCGKVAVLSVLAVVGAFLPIGVGILLGNDFHQSSIKMVQIKINYWKVFSKLLQHVKETLFWTENIYMILLWPVYLVLFLGLIKNKDRNKLFLLFSLSLSIFIMFLMYRVPFINSNVKLPELLDKNRIGPFFALMLAPFYAFGLTVFKELVIDLAEKLKARPVKFVNYLYQFAIYSFCFFIIIGSLPIHLFKGTEEYDAAAEQYLRIKKSFPKYDWTLVAPHEQFAQALGSGYQYQMYQFVSKFKVKEIGNSDFKFPIPTHHIFFFIEKRPLHFNREVGFKDAQKEMESMSNDPFMQYYKNPEQRAVMEAKAMVLVDAFARGHKGAVQIFYEDSNMRIYHLYQSEI